MSLHPVIPKALMESITTTFKVQAETNVKILPPSPFRAQASHAIDLIAVINMKGSEIAGSLALCFPKETLLAVLNKMLGESYVAIDDENADAAGELLNIIYASARIKFNEQDLGFEPAIPTVIRGQGIVVAHKVPQSVLMIQCESDAGPFHIEISLEKLAKAA